VITLPDRVSHAFWRFHRPEDYPPVPAAELAENRERMRDAYRESDRLLARLVERLGPEVTYLIVSDHGSASVPGRYGGHRVEGMLVVAGPGVMPAAERGRASIYDVTPLALALLGLPPAGDLAGRAPEGWVAGAGPLEAIASYELDDAGASGRSPGTATIDESTQEQLRGLGYLE
jgi:predicted AlkP superfamily phosphohydrolase/phosphomutase